MLDPDMLHEKIRRLKKSRNALLLAHNYQVEEVQLAADHVGDSLELSRLAAATDKSVIVFAGVKFMAETAKILAPTKQVLLPRLDAGCPMADMITVGELQAMKREFPRAKVVAYVNSSVEIKAEADACCTSANAVQVVSNMPAEEIIFVPDCNLGGYVQRLVPHKKVHLFEAYCYVHNRIRIEELETMKSRHAAAKVLIHPEVRPDLLVLADEVLSTSGMLRFVAASAVSEFIVATEEGLLQRMRRENPGKRFFSVVTPKICQNMKRTALLDVLHSMEHGVYNIEVDEAIRAKALHALQTMIQYG